MLKHVLVVMFAVGLLHSAPRTASAVGQIHAYFPLDEGTGTTTDDGFGSRTGTLTNFGVPNAAWSGEAAPLSISNPTSIEFGADNGYVNFGDMELTSGTLAFWARPTATATETRIFSQVTGPSTNGGGTRHNGSGLQVWSGAAWLGSTTALTLNVWQHLAYVSDGTSIDIYLNGNLEDTVTSDFDYDGVEFGLGARLLDSFGLPFAGQLDDVAFFTDQLSQEDISFLASGGSVLPVPLAPEPGTIVLFAILLTVLAGYYFRRHRLAKMAA